MSEIIYRGESATIVLRCCNRDGQAVAMAAKEVLVLMVDRRGGTVFEFSTAATGSRKIIVDRNYLLCTLTYLDMSRLQGVYLVEIRVKEGEVVQIAQLPGVRIHDSITGKRF